jgi:hypothetical protein
MIRLAPLWLVLPVVARAAQPIALSEDEFKMVRHYQIALEDARVQKMPEGKRMPAIAKDSGYKLKDLQRALKKADAQGDVKAPCEANIKESIDAAPLAGRISKVNVDTSEAHAVAYVEWVNENATLLEEEAAAVAFRTAQACPILSSIQVWATDKANASARIFQALIARGAAQRINPDRIKDFAQTRYIKLFEKVKNASKGDTLDGAAARGGQR